MSINQLIENELVELRKAKQRLLARGQWLKAHDVETIEDYLPKLKQRVAKDCPETPNQMVPP